MATTFTASAQNATPRKPHVGLFAVRSTHTAGGTTLSTSDIILCMKIPTGTWVVDGMISGTAGGGALNLKVGLGSTDNNLLSLGTLSATAQVKRFDGGNLPIKVSVSDDASTRYQYVFITQNGGSLTATHSVQVTVWCARDL